MNIHGIIGALIFIVVILLSANVLITTKDTTSSSDGLYSKILSTENTIVVPANRDYSVCIVEEKEQHTLIELLPSEVKTYVYIFRGNNPPSAGDWVILPMEGEWSNETE